MGWWSLLCFVDEQTEAEAGHVTGPWSHAQERAEWGFKSGIM